MCGVMYVLFPYAGSCLEPEPGAHRKLVGNLAYIKTTKSHKKPKTDAGNLSNENGRATRHQVK